MRAYKETSLQDCMCITKKFERGAAFTPTEQAGFALLSPLLDGMRTNSKNYVSQAESVERLSTPLSAQESSDAALATGNEQPGLNVNNMDKSSEKDQDFSQKIAGQFGLTNEQNNFNMTNVFNSECIPCGLRMDDAGLGAFFTELGVSVLRGLAEYLNFWQNLFMKQLGQLQDMLSLFNNVDPYLDLCAFIKFFTEFVCIPDFAKIISVLMALMMKVNFEFSGVLDIILMLVGPLLTPFLGNLVAILEQFIMMVVKPIECIIDSIQAMIAKLDYNVLFENISGLDKHVDLGGPKKGAWLPGNEENEAKYRKDDPRGDYAFRLDKPRLDADEPRTPWVDGHIARRDIVEGERFAEFDFNMAGPLSTWIDSTNAEDQKAIEQAAEELAAIRKAGRGIDGSNPSAIAKQRKKERAAEEKYKGAIEKRNMSYVGRANKAVDRGVAGVKSSLIMIIGFLREGAQAVQGFFDFIFDEFKKLMGEYVGGTGGMIGDIIKKNALSQIINLLVSIFKALQKGAVCDDQPEDFKVEPWLPELQGFRVWTDDTGSIHIEGNQAELDAALQATVEAVGVQRDSLQKKLDGGGDGTSKPELDRGGTPDTTSQKLKSLIEFTGDPVLDSEIARTTELATRQVNVVFKCPLNTSVAQTEQINQWIQEVNS